MWLEVRFFSFFFFKCLVIVVLEDAPEKTKQTKQKHTDFK